MNKASHFRQLWQHFGPEWLASRAIYVARLRTGLLRRQIPSAEWDDQPLRKFIDDAALAEPERYLDYRRGKAPAFFFQPSAREQYQSAFKMWDEESQTIPQTIAREIASGTHRYFEHSRAQTGFPPDWHTNPFTGQTAPDDRHWSEISDFSHGDIKVIWEPSRFGFVYALVRAYWRTGDESYASLFWQLLEDWRQRNLPQRGPNWKCGQETSFRVMAWCFALYGFMDALATTPERLTALSQMIAVSGQRIEANLDYAISQRNNHGISEGVGLWTIGALFPELRDSSRWKELGKSVLESLGKELIYSDGSFVQHSLNYQRLMLQDYLWSMRLGELHGEPFSADLRERVSKAGFFLYQVQNQENGRVPNYGQNDGALILPLNNCDYRDFRPVVQATQYLSKGTRCYEPGPWDEDLLWLFGPAAADAAVVAPQRADLQAETGGYYTLRSPAGFAFVRCASFRDRPGQADMLHVDLWWRGQNLALDAGTYSYNAPAPWNNSLAQTTYHNTVTVDEQDQMERAGKFLWVPWLRSRAREQKRSSSGRLSYWEGEHDGYQRLNVPVSHRRAIIRLGEVWVVLDNLDSVGEHSYRLHWLFDDFPYEWNGETGKLTLRTPAGSYYVQVGTLNSEAVYSLVRADQQSPRGWQSPYYNSRQPALSVDLLSQTASLRFWTVFSPEPCSVAIDETALGIKTERWHATINLHAGGIDQPTMAGSIAVAGDLQDQLQIS